MVLVGTVGVKLLVGYLLNIRDDVGEDDVFGIILSC